MDIASASEIGSRGFDSEKILFWEILSPEILSLEILSLGILSLEISSAEIFSSESLPPEARTLKNPRGYGVGREWHVWMAPNNHFWGRVNKKNAMASEPGAPPAPPQPPKRLHPGGPCTAPAAPHSQDDPQTDAAAVAAEVPAGRMMATPPRRELPPPPAGGVRNHNT